MKLAAAHGVMLAPFHSRRWDSDFLTLRKLLHEGSLGRLVYFESTMDRWRPAPTARMPWKNDPAQGGLLLDLGLISPTSRWRSSGTRRQSMPRSSASATAKERMTVSHCGSAIQDSRSFSLPTRSPRWSGPVTICAEQEAIM